MDGSSFDGTNVYVEPATFCGVAARMLAAGGRDSVPAVLTLLGQALQSDVGLIESSSARRVIPRPRIRRAHPDVIGLDAPPPIELPVRAGDTVLAVLAIEPPVGGLPEAWAAAPGPLATIADLLALVLAGGGPEGEASVNRSQTWLALEEADRAELAGQLHDGLVQSLVAARYLLDLASTTWSDGPMPWLDAVREGLSAALVDGRALLNTVQPRTRSGRGIRVALEELCGSYRIPVQLQVTGAGSAEQVAAGHVMDAAAFRFVQSALADLVQRGGDAADVCLKTGATGMSIDVVAVGDRPAWPDEPGDALQRWATRIELLGGSVLLQPGSAHLRFGPADGDREPLTQDVHAGRTK